MKAFAFAFAFAFGFGFAGADEGRLERAEREMARGHHLMDQHDYAGALTHFEAARALAPETSGPYLAIGLAAVGLGHCQQAIPALQEYLRRKPDSPAPAAQPALQSCRLRLSPPAQVKGTLHIESIPMGSAVRIDETEDEPAGLTPLDLVLTPGTHTVYLSHEGYVSGSFESTVVAGEVTRLALSLELTPLPLPKVAPLPAPARGRMELFVEPPPVTVSINGGRMPGTGPSFGAELPAGIYRVVIEKAGHEPEYRDVFVRAGETVTQRHTFATKNSLARRRGITAVAVLVPLVVVGAAIGLGVGLTRGSSTGSGKETNFGTINLP